ncbi:MAG TPA: hypothetical protein VMF32_11235 [Xanthobacteraceae bacterium]|nr:hypothetical protein [Xanthobacteraceae bacterium]
MLRSAAVTLVALATLDYFYFNGWFTHAVEAVLLNGLHFIAG